VRRDTAPPPAAPGRAGAGAVGVRARPADAAPRPSLLDGARILIVDDDRAMVTALAKMIRPGGGIPLCATSWSEAIRIARQAQPDLALIDLVMPGIDGFKLSRILKRERSAFLPIILLTAAGDIDAKRRGAASGADDFLIKPVTAVELQIRISAMLRIKALTDQLSSTHAQLAELAVTDGLTRVRNRRSLDDILERELVRARRYGHPLAALMVDVDHFKRVNDEHGHAVGDRVLAMTAATLSASVRELDVVGRYGGEEFVIVAPETAIADAAAMAERARADVEEASDGRQLPRVTVSIGIAATDAVPAGDVQELVSAADAALYQAKRSGRNRCVTWSPALTRPPS
jgi:diguanylate cyclase (GGDEF)-like protein